MWHAFPKVHLPLSSFPLGDFFSLVSFQNIGNFSHIQTSIPLLINPMEYSSYREDDSFSASLENIRVFGNLKVRFVFTKARQFSLFWARLNQFRTILFYENLLISALRFFIILDKFFVSLLILNYIIY
jgi:hypothetical protein